MKTMKFTASTLDEAKKAKERWLSVNKGASVKKEWTTPDLKKPAGRFTPIAFGTAAFVELCIEYEDSK
ncbi:MAG: hypothetical protein ACHQAY_20995 [Hyphomicrobiales bacterium]